MIVGTSTPGFGVFLLVVSALQADPVSVKRVAFSRRYISNPAPPLLKLEFVRGWRTKLNETASIREGGGDEYCAGETRLCACAQEWVSERERERESQRMEDGRISGERRGATQRDRAERSWTPNYAHINAEPKVPEGGSAGWDCRARVHNREQRWLVCMLTQLRFHCRDRYKHYKVVWRTTVNVLQN